MNTELDIAKAETFMRKHVAEHVDENTGRVYRSGLTLAAIREQTGPMTLVGQAANNFWAAKPVQAVQALAWTIAGEFEVQK